MSNTMQLECVIRYHAHNPSRYYYSTRFRENWWTFDGVVFFGVGRLHSYAEEIYQFSAETPKSPSRYFYGFKEEAPEGWKLERVAFHAFRKPIEGKTLAVARYHADDPSRYFYRLQGSDPAPPGWINDGERFHVFAAEPIIV